MANLFKRKDYGKWDVFRRSYSRNELEKRRRRLAKVANSRILKLIRGKSYITGESFIKAPQFVTVLSYLNTQSRQRFSEVQSPKNMSDFELKREITVLEDFLQMQSSTVGGYRVIEDKRINSFIMKGVPEEIATNPEFWRFLSSETFRQLELTTMTSEDIIDYFGDDNDSKLTLEEIISTFEQHLQTPNATYQDLQRRFKTQTLYRDIFQ